MPIDPRDITWDGEVTWDDEKPKKPRDLAGYAGLAGRAAVKAGAALPAMLADAITGPLNYAQDKILGEGRGYRFQSQLPALDAVMSRMGLPEPNTPMERVASKGLEVSLGAGAAAKGADLLSRGLTGVSQHVAQQLAANPGIQMSGGLGSGLAGQQSAESGQGFGGQLLSSMLGGMAGAAGMQKVGGLLAGTTPRAPQMQEIERRVMISLENQGIDPRSITPALKSSLMQDAAKAMQTGGTLDDMALARLADYRRLGLTPTRGRLTLDPYDVTREMNAAKVAANIGATESQLPQIAQANNRGLLGAVENMNPREDLFGLGEAAKAPILARDAALKAREQGLYRAAEQTAGGTIPLQRGALNGVYDELTKARKLRFLPAEVSGTIDDILKDTRAPFTVNELDSLKTTIATAQRGTTDGNVKQSLKIVRDYLDNMPLTPEKRTFGGNQVVTAEGAQFLREQDALAGKTKEALDKARGAAFDRRTWQRSAPMIEDALDDATGETFIRKHVLSPSAGFKDLSKAASVINQDAGAKEAIRSAIVQHLKDAGIGKGNTAETANFSGRQWARALADIGDKKLGLFFGPDELESLKAIGRVGSTETFQPRGSAVNNSNTAATAAGLVSRWAGALPGVGPLVADPLSRGARQAGISWTERQATNIPRSLLAQQPQTIGGGLLDQLILPSVMTGGLLSAP